MKHSSLNLSDTPNFNLGSGTYSFERKWKGVSLKNVSEKEFPLKFKYNSKAYKCI